MVLELQRFTPRSFAVPDHPQLTAVSAPFRPSQQTEVLPSHVDKKMEDSVGSVGASFQEPVKPSLASPNEVTNFSANQTRPALELVDLTDPVLSTVDSPATSKMSSKFASTIKYSPDSTTEEIDANRT